MVRVSENKKKKEADPVTSKYFLNSIMSWYNKDGIKVGVEKVSSLYENKNDKTKRGIAVTLSILGDMPKCRARVIDDDGEVVKVYDDVTGETRDEIAIISDPDMVTFFYNVRLEDEELNEFSVNNLSSCFPLFNFAFIATGDLPIDNEKGFICTIDELKAALSGLEFIAKAEKRSFKGGNPYMVLIPSEYIGEN